MRSRNPVRRGFKGSRHHVGPGARSGGDSSLTLGVVPSFEQHNVLLPWAELPGMQTGFKVHPGVPQSLSSEVLIPVVRIRATSLHCLWEQGAMIGSPRVVYSKAAPVLGLLCDCGHVPRSLCALEPSDNGAALHGTVMVPKCMSTYEAHRTGSW